MAVPEASGAAEGGEAAFGGDAGSGQDEEAVLGGEVHDGSFSLWVEQRVSPLASHDGLCCASACEVRKVEQTTANAKAKCGDPSTPLRLTTFAQGPVGMTQFLHYWRLGEQATANPAQQQLKL